MLKHQYLIQPYNTGKGNRSLAMILPQSVVKELKFDPLTMLLLLKVNGTDDLVIKIIREENLMKNNPENMIPAEKFPTLSKQISVATAGED